MENVIMVGCDAHSKNLMLMCAVEKSEAEKLEFNNDRAGRIAMIAELKRRAVRHESKRIVFAYEASSLGFGLYDETTDAGIECYVLAPTKIESSIQQRKTKTDERDAKKILEVVRGYILAGNKLPSIWVPDPETRDHRELLRTRLDVSDKIAAVKIQIKSLLKRNDLRQLKKIKSCWSQTYIGWLESLTYKDELLGFGAREALKSLLNQKIVLENEMEDLNKVIFALAQTERYVKPVYALMQERGVGLLTAMVFLTELGDLSRFKNRREIGKYIGIVPSSYESGKGTERKGHITCQGPSRVRKVLCQAVWAIIRGESSPEREAYERVVARNPKHKKIAVVMLMRRLAIRMWHIGVKAQQENGIFGKTNKVA